MISLQTAQLSNETRQKVVHIALYSKGHSVIEIRRWLNAENIIRRLVLHRGKKLIRNHWMGTLSLYSETISVTCRVEKLRN